ncbi:MAG: ABC transporter ATP-binding protein [Chromatiales bacterium]|jgi:ATP-binding cassette, subfamily B, multidrug efflux pump|nr:ABC transporter ATP-binding protein [Chromatiales bacterium]
MTVEAVNDSDQTVDDSERLRLGRGLRRPPRAVVGSQVDMDEEIFGAAFDRVVVRRFWDFVVPYKKMLALGLAGVLLFTLTQVAVPLMMRFAIDDALVLSGDGLSLLHQIVMAFFAIITVNYLANLSQELIVGRLSGHLLFDLRRAMYHHLQWVSLSFMDKTEVGRLMSRLQGDVSALQEFLETSIFAIGDLVLLFGICAVLIWLDPELGLLTLIVVPILIGVRVVWIPFAKLAFTSARESSSVANGALAENVHGIRAIQAMTREKVNLDLFEELARHNLQTHQRASKLTNIMIPVVDCLTGGAMAMIVVIGGGRVLDGTMELGVMVAFIFYVQRFFDPIRSLTIQYSIMQRAMAAGQRIFEVLDVPYEVTDKPGAEAVKHVDASIQFSNVTFGYTDNLPVLRNISFNVKPGETVALVGPTGSGKTSTMALAHRFYDVWEGSVRVGGHDVRDVTQESLGQQIAMVLQEPFLFSGTVADNIRYRTPNVSQASIEEAAMAVGASQFIKNLPQGYETVLEQRGSNLSLGQRQLLSFARALVADAPILILDEATANVDSYTERQIQLALKRLLEGRTAMVIAHRLGTIRDADRILVLRDGEIIEEGNHEQLLAGQRLYSQLYKMNFSSFDDLPEAVGES